MPMASPTTNGKIVLISVGMSNTTQEFSTFIRLANADSAKSPKVVIVDGAQGGQTANVWANPGPSRALGCAGPAAQASGRYGTAGASGLDQAGPSRSRVSWGVPQTRRGVEGAHGRAFGTVAHRFPNVRIAYLSSRIYAGYARTHLNPEPYAYESAFVVRWLIEDQINGEERSVKSPLLLWGPYLWAMAKKAGRSTISSGSRKIWGDGTHPSPSGRRKVAELLLRSFSRPIPRRRRGSRKMTDNETFP